MENDLFIHSIGFKILKRFFILKKEERLETISQELKLSPAIIRNELSKLENLELIVGTPFRKVIYYKANEMHSNYNEMSEFLENYIKFGIKKSLKLTTD
jgi:Mn-dependent DtxR family transcriptional regulator